MDLMILRRRLAHFQEMMEPLLVLVKSIRLILRKRSKILVAFLVALPFLVLAMMVYKEPILHSSNKTAVSKATTISRPFHNSTPPTPEISILKFSSSRNQSTSKVAKDKFLGGLLSPGFPEESCISMYTSFLYHKASPHKPSTFLLSKLRNYEKLHKLCGPNSKPYKESLLLLSGNINKSSTPGGGECRYLVWIAYSGLGNRILTIASAFLYALLTNRILLLEQQPDMAHLFCEPFPNSSWLLPMDFPFRKNLGSFDQKYAYSHGNLLKKNVISINSSSELSSLMYAHLGHDYDDHDKLFFCDEHQAVLRQVPWLIMRTDNYFVPSLFLMQSFEQELIKLFPNKETIFHHLGRYLFHPSNQVWGLITRYYQAYLSKADERIGLQIRIIDTRTSPFQAVMDQILACTKKEKLLPEIDTKKTVSFDDSEQEKISKVVLITSLYSGFFENIKNKYWAHPTVNGEVVGVYQPSHEEEQKYENKMHNIKAWAEMYLLSMCDVLVTSGWSTFGYVAQGLGGLRPWILYRIENQAAPDPPCARVMSMEPCFHSPPIYHCKTKKYVDNGALVPHVRHCEDLSWGLKLFDTDSHQ